MILRPTLAILAGVLILAAPAAAAAAAPRPSALAGALAAYEALERSYDPMSAGREGDRAALARLPDRSPATLKAERADLARLRTRLRAVPPAGLKPDDLVTRDLLLRELDERIEGLDADDARLNFDSYSGFHLTLQHVAQTTRLRDAEDARAYVKRLEDAPRFYAVETANARRGVATGFTQPRPTVEAVLKVARRQAEQPPETSPLLAPLASPPHDLAPAEAAALRERALRAVREGVAPAQAAFVRFLETEYLPHARASLAARDLPGGEAWYARQVRHHTTTNLTPDQIHAIGLSEVKRIRGEMEAVIARAGFTGGFAAWQRKLRTDPRYYVTSGDDLLRRSALFNKRMDDQLPRFFATLPRLPFAVRPIPDESADGATTAYYQQGAPALHLAGGYMVNLTHLDQRPLYEIPALSLHESEPGHHLQIALGQERTDLPRFRRNGYFTAFGEGWGLYAERLGVEMGAYTTPEEEFGRLSYEMWRACRLVADTGLHWLRWSRAEAKACFTDNTALSDKNIEVELDRYISWPGQALAYKIGQLKLLELRARAERALGPRFDIRRFHDAVLLDGALPLDVLETKIDRWIAAEGARA